MELNYTQYKAEPRVTDGWYRVMIVELRERPRGGITFKLRLLDTQEAVIVNDTIAYNPQKPDDTMWKFIAFTDTFLKDKPAPGTPVKYDEDTFLGQYGWVFLWTKDSPTDLPSLQVKYHPSVVPMLGRYNEPLQPLEGNLGEKPVLVGVHDEPVAKATQPTTQAPSPAPAQPQPAADDQIPGAEVHPAQQPAQAPAPQQPAQAPAYQAQVSAPPSATPPSHVPPQAPASPTPSATPPGAPYAQVPTPPPAQVKSGGRRLVGGSAALEGYKSN